MERAKKTTAVRNPEPRAWASERERLRVINKGMSAIHPKNPRENFGKLRLSKIPERTGRKKNLLLTAVALFVLFSAPARAGIITADFGFLTPVGFGI